MTNKRPPVGRISLLALALIAAPALAQPTPRPQSPALRNSTPVVLNFVNADVEAVTRAIGVMLDRQFVIDPRVKGQITVYSEQPLTVREAYLNYLAALRGMGFTVVDSAGVLKVVPEADAKLQSGSVAIGNNNIRGDQIITQIFRINHENANNLVAVLRPLISPNNTINANPGNNSLVITDYAENLQRIAKIIAAMDTPGSTDIEVVPLRYALASDIAALVQKLSDGGVAAAPGQVAAGGLSVLADPRGNALILRAANPARLASVRAMIEKLDQPGGDSASNIRVVYLKNADAAKLATVLRAAFSGTATGNAGGSSGNNGSSSMVSSPLSGAAQAGNSGSSSGTSAAATTPVSASQGPSTGGFVQADPSTNSLIITAAEPLYRQIRNVIDQLDGRRAQVYVETMIVKVDVSKSAQFGVQWQNLFGSNVGVGTNFRNNPGNILDQSAGLASAITPSQTTSIVNANGVITTTTSPTTINPAAATSLIGSVGAGLNVGIVKKIAGFLTLGAVANFLEGQSGANVLSTPNLVALDNEEAKIVIGQNVPFVTGSFSTASTSGTTNPFQTIDRKDVGLTLRIRSQIGENGTVRMTVFQENSSVTSISASTGPTTDKSSIETTVVVDDGQIMVLGGLLKDEYSDADDRVPGLGGLPLIGNLFKSEKRARIKTNLMVFLRPVVMRNQSSADQLTLDRYESIRALQQTSQPAYSPVLPDTGAPVLPPSPATPAGGQSQPRKATVAPPQ